MARIARFVIAAVTVALLASCAAAPATPPPLKPSPRETTCALPADGADFAAANPDATGVKADAVQHAINVIAPMLTTSMRVYRHGCLIGKTNIDDAEKNEPQQFFSATKTVVSLLAGRAVTMGKLSVDDPIGKYLPEADAAHGAITVRELLTQTSGLRFAWANDLLTSIKDGEREALNLPFVHEPGTYFEYAQTTITLLGIVVERAVGEDLQTFATTNLFEPIGIKPGTWTWERDGMGHTHGYAWLMMSPIAMGKLGTLVLHNGEWGRQRIIDASYIREMGTPTATNGSYGFLTWTNRGVGGYDAFGRHFHGGREIPSAPVDMVQFSGFLDQAIFIVPSLDMVITRSGISATPGWDYEMFRTLVPAVRGHANYKDPGPYVQGPTDVPIDELVDLPLLIHEIFNNGA